MAENAALCRVFWDLRGGHSTQVLGVAPSADQNGRPLSARQHLSISRQLGGSSGEPLPS
jgi:hypothetical protein